MPFDAAAGEHVQFTVWNEPMGGWFARLLFIFIGAAALKLGITPGSAPGPSGRCFVAAALRPAAGRRAA